MSSWNRIGPKDRYRMTLLGTEKEWLRKKEEVTNKGRIILNEGSAKSSQGGSLKYWADVLIPSTQEG